MQFLYLKLIISGTQILTSISKSRIYFDLVQNSGSMAAPKSFSRGLSFNTVFFLNTNVP